MALANGPEKGGKRKSLHAMRNEEVSGSQVLLKPPRDIDEGLELGLGAAEGV